MAKTFCAMKPRQNKCIAYTKHQTMRIFFTIFLLMTCGIFRGQNLVPNSGFEQYYGCPTSGAQIDSCMFWKRIGMGTPDYFNACATNHWQPDVPNTWNGYQNSHEGNAMAGFYASQRQYGDNHREYLQVKLLEPLDSGTIYYIHFYVNLQNSSFYSIGTIGAYISDTIINPFYDDDRLIVTPQIVYNTSYSISDTLNWTLVSGTFVPSVNNLQFLTIGNFFSDSSSRITNLLSSSGGNSYYFIDDVCISSDPNNCRSVDVINDPIVEGKLILFPNPFHDKINVMHYTNQLIEINLYDVTARKALSKSFTQTTSISTEQLEKGIYFYEVRNTEGVIKKGKIIKQ